MKHRPIAVGLQGKLNQLGMTHLLQRVLRAMVLKTRKNDQRINR